jgi:DNA-binding transcriptional MerR regulator
VCSARLLRYYDELGLLKPGVVDAATVSATTRARKLQRLNRILVLRDLGLSLEQIGGVIDQDASPDRTPRHARIAARGRRAALAERAPGCGRSKTRIAQLDSGCGVDDVLMRAARAPHRSRCATPWVVRRRRADHGELADLAEAHAAGFAGSIIGIAHSAEFERLMPSRRTGFVWTRLTSGPGLPRWGINRLHLRELAAVAHMATCVRVGLPEHAHLITQDRALRGEQRYRLSGPSREVFLRPRVRIAWKSTVVEMQFPVERA